MFEPWIVVIVVAVLLAAVVVLIVALRSRISRHRAELEREREARERSLAVAEQEFSLQLDQARRQAEDAETLADRMRLFTARALQWDTASRDLVAEVGRELNIDGCLASNVLFTVRERSGKPFIAQIDHVLLTDRAAYVIENKFWAGTVFDGLLPSAVHPAFASLVDEGALGSEFALRMKREDGGVSVLVKSGGESPRAQSRRQAARLSGAIEERFGVTQWFDPYVLYSHPNASLFVEPTAGAAARRAPVLQGAQGVRSLLRGAARPAGGRGQVDVVRIGDALAALGADVVGLGTYAERWVSSLG